MVKTREKPGFLKNVSHFIAFLVHFRNKSKSYDPFWEIQRRI